MTQNVRDVAKAALRGEASYIWRAGQQRRLDMMQQAAGDRLGKRVLDNGCGVGIYLEQLAREAGAAHGLEYDFPRATAAVHRVQNIVQGAGEHMPYADESFDLVLSHEVLEHVQDDQAAVREIVRVLKPGGRLLLFVPNRGYPFETHGVYWRGRYHFGNIPLVNYLPRFLRQRLAPHVRAYSGRDLMRLFQSTPVRTRSKTIIYGAYDNIIARWPRWGRAIRGLLQWLESTPLRALGLSHFWVVEKL